MKDVPAYSFANLKIPPGWECRIEGHDGYLWYNRKKGLSVIASVSFEEDNRQWLHLSMAHTRRVPTYYELCYLKRHWAGEEHKCIMIFPPRSEHVNFHPNCLHLFCCLSEDIIPDFTHGLGTI